jgi:hypothetical protein
MAFQFATPSAILNRPGAYPEVTVQSNPSGLSTTGTITVVGEADAGPRFSDEADLGLNSFGPDQVAEFMAKYQSGPLVDAFRGAVAASNDPNIVGSFSKVIAVKTNASVAAVGTLAAIGSGVFADLKARVAGRKGSLIASVVESAVAEVVPTTGSCLIAPPQVSTNVEFRVNGGAAVTASLSAAELPSAVVSAINALTGVAASGGVSRAIVTAVAGSVTVAIVSGLKATFTISGATWAALPTVGDLFYIPTGSPFATANEGSYVVTAASGLVITGYKLLNAAGTGAQITAPTAEGPVAIAATTDLQAFSPVVISVEAGAVSPGLGKSLEIADTSTGSFADVSFEFDGASASPPASHPTWNSVSGTPAVITSEEEYQVTVTFSRQSDAVSDSVTTGGKVLLTVGYTGTTASAVIADGIMTITVAGGSGDNQVLDLSDFSTIGDLATYINSLTGFTAAAGDATLAQRSALDLDAGTYTLASKWGAKTGRIKGDGASFFVDVNGGNTLVDVTPVSPATALVGLPDVSSLTFLSGGARGGTSNSDISAAIEALNGVRCNFVVPLFSRDATADISGGTTDSSSTYTIESVHALTRSHVLISSQLKNRRPRQAFLSYKGTFKEAKAAASNMASSRCSMTFQDIRTTDANGNIKQFQPWMGAVKAAGMQAAGFYKAIVFKFVNITGALQAAGDYNDQIDSHVTAALKAGLLPITRDVSGGFKWESDQTTYTKDDDFVFNSIQAMYATDTTSLTVAERMELTFVGQSLADISASLALTTLEGIMADIKRLKLTAASDDAPLGFKGASIKISQTSMSVALEIKVAGAIYFIPISFLVTPVQQSAG